MRADINYATKLLVVQPSPSYHGEVVDEIIQSKVSRIGFGIKRQSDGWLQRFGENLNNESTQKITWPYISVIWFLAMWSSMFAFAGYMGGVDATELYYLHLASSIFGLPAIILGAIPCASSGLRALIYSRLLTLDFFIFIGATSAFGVTTYSLFKGINISYADSGSMILSILLLTKKIETSLMTKVTWLNDTIALSKANVSFRIGHRIKGLSPVDFQLQRPDLKLIISVFMYSKKYKKVLIQTVIAAAIYNIIAITLAAFGRFSPLGAVVAMTLSFSLMFLSTLRLKKWRL